MLTIHRSNRLEILADRLAEILREPAGTPFAAETILVQNQGMGRWLSLELARRLGIAANISFRFPANYVWELIRAALPEVPATSPYETEVMAWRILSALEKPEKIKGGTPLTSYLRGSEPDLRRFDLARRIAAVFGGYLIYRPEWPARWQEGKKVGLGSDEVWQADLWRRIARREDGSLPRHPREDFIRLLDAGELAEGVLPTRLVLFGLPDLPPLYWSTTCRIAGKVETHIFLLSPSRTAWAGMEAGRGAARHPLLAAWGRQGAAMSRQTEGCAGAERETYGEPQGDTLLARLQREIFNDAASEETVAQASGDRSLQVHSCHGPLRELEVLHDRLLDLFERHPDLGLSDVVVLTPDLETYAIAIEGVFGAAVPAIPFRIADQAAVQGGACTRSFLGLLELASSRWEAGRVLGLLENPVVARRFALEEDDLALVRRWLGETGIRWGRDAGHRAHLGLPATGEHSWEAGFDRLTLGLALRGKGEVLVGGVLPWDGVEGDAARTLGRLAGAMEFLEELTSSASRRQTPGEWAGLLHGALAALAQPEGDDEEADLASLHRFLSGMEAAAMAGGFSGTIPLEVVRVLVVEGLAETSGERFPAGEVTCGSLRPGRSIPFRIVCLVGMNDGAFPRADRPPGFDLAAREPREGDRDRREEDRWLLLEQLLAARDVLIITYTGQGIRDNGTIPPAVPVSELLDHVRRMAGGDAAARVLVKHPLQPFSRRYFQAPVDGKDQGLFSFNADLCLACKGARPARREYSPLVTAPLDQPSAELLTVSVDDLARFYENPARGFLKNRLGIRPPGEEGMPDDREPFDLANYADVDLRRRLVSGILEGKDPEAMARAEAASGILPQGRYGRVIFGEEARRAAVFAGRLRSLLVPAPVVLEVDLVLAGVRLTGRVDLTGKDGYLGWDPGKWWPGRWFGLWIRHLLVNHLQPAPGGRQSLWVAEDSTITLGVVADAAKHLTLLLEQYVQGLCEPLPLFPRSSVAAAKQMKKGKSPEEALDAARKEWEGCDRHQGEQEKPWNRFAFRDSDPIGERFLDLARVLVLPILEAET